MPCRAALHLGPGRRQVDLVRVRVRVMVRVRVRASVCASRESEKYLGE